jgi:heme-degrading monooxygenase HmoA
MAEIYTTGRWQPNPGKDAAFIEAWGRFAAWASDMPGAGTLRLTRDARDARDARTFLSFGRWESIDAVRAWKSDPDFRERMAQVLQHVDEFEATELALVATAAAGTASAAASHPAGEPVRAL